MKYLIFIFLFWNFIVFLLFGIDKYKAKKNRWRIPEHTLLTCSFLLGSLGGFAGMKIFHHKTRHKKFSIGLPLMLALHFFLFILFFNSIQQDILPYTTL